ncbi:MAG: hypothetical protein U0N32_12265, partial [Oscillospiraceae bacterium]
LADSPQILEGIHCILPGGAEPRPYQLRLHFNGFCVKQTVYGLKLMTLGCRGGFGLLIRLERAHRFRKEHWHNKYS